MLESMGVIVRVNGADDRINGADDGINGSDDGINGADSISLGEGVNDENSEGYKING